MASRSQRQSPSLTSTRILIGLFIIALGGAGILASGWVRENPAAASLIASEEALSKPQELSLEFRDLLAEQRMNVEATQTERSTGAPHYLWAQHQWRTDEELENAHAQMALLNIPMRVLSQVKRGNSGTVRFGPFFSSSERNNARQELVKLNIQANTQPPKPSP